MQMPDDIFEYLKGYAEYILIAGGIFIIIGAIRDWKWLTTMRGSKMIGTREFIKELHGEEARHKFDRFITGLGGVLLIVAGIIFLLYKKKIL